MTLIKRGVSGALFVLTGCLAGSVGAIAAEMTAAQSEQLAMVPEGAKTVYDGFWNTTELHRLPADWKPHKAPYQFCHNESYQGNTWRSNLLAELQKQVAAYAKAGLSKGDLIITNANGDASTQLSQFNSLVAQGCDVIFSVPVSPTGLCSGIRDAAQKGVLVVTMESPVVCPEAVNVAQNAYAESLAAARWLFSTVDNKGNLLAVTGFAGNSIMVAGQRAVDQALSETPGIKKIGEVNGNWTPSVAKSEVLKFVATHPQPINAVWSGGLMGVASGQALTQAGRKPVPVSDMDNECSFVAYMKQNPSVPMRAVVDGGAPVGYTAFTVASRILAGQRLALNTILYKLPEITRDTIDQYYDPSMTLQSTCWADPKDGRLVPDSYLDQFFSGGEKPPVVLTP